jgi:hypothetical protein
MISGPFDFSTGPFCACLPNDTFCVHKLLSSRGPLPLGMPVTESVVLPPNFKVDTLWNNNHRPRKGVRLLLINLSEMKN